MNAAVHANVSQVAGRLWIAGDLDTRRPTMAGVQLNELLDLGITDILDCRIEWNDESFVAERTPGLGYRWLGVDDAGQRMSDEWFEVGTGDVRDRIAAGGVVLTHCHMGINRGPSMGFAVLLTLGWEPIEALNRIRQSRPIAHVAYAEDALDWWLRHSGASELQRAAGASRIALWRRMNRMDVADVIRRIRLEERA